MPWGLFYDQGEQQMLKFLATKRRPLTQKSPKVLFTNMVTLGGQPGGIVLNENISQKRTQAPESILK